MNRVLLNTIKYLLSLHKYKDISIMQYHPYTSIPLVFSCQGIVLNYLTGNHIDLFLYSSPYETGHKVTNPLPNCHKCHIPLPP